MVRLQTLDLRIGVRLPASQPNPKAQYIREFYIPITLRV